MTIKNLPAICKTTLLKKRIRADSTGGAESGVDGTPTFFINSVHYDDEVSYETLLAALESA